MNPLSIFSIIVLIFSAIVHEVAHGYAAERLGDSTARLAGRLTFNPLPHIDFWGSIMIPGILILSGSPMVFGWAKPVPYNPNNLHRDYRYGPLKVALAGPGSNILLFLLFGILIRFGQGIFSPALLLLFSLIALINIILALFNLIPIPPLDGSKILTILSPRYEMEIERIGMFGILFVVLLIFYFGNVLFSAAQFLFSLVTGVAF